jgi:4-aminobutyrate aminotransferase-like enzyme
MNHDMLLQRRFRVLGRHSPLFYERPLELVRGEGVWVWDRDGKRYLDAYNNVPHVGHCHPRVVAALGRQAATLNTHTRYLHEGIVAYADD